MIQSVSDDHFKWQSSVTGSYASGRLKNLRDIDKWSSLSLRISVREMTVIRKFGLYLHSWDGSMACTYLYYKEILRQVHTTPYHDIWYLVCALLLFRGLTLEILRILFIFMTIVLWTHHSWCKFHQFTVIQSIFLLLLFT